MNQNLTPAKTVTVNLDFNPTSDIAKTIYTKQLDALWRTVTVKLTTEGAVFIKPSVWDIKLRGTKPNGSVFDLLPAEQDIEKGLYTFILSKSILDVSGIIVCDVVCSAMADLTYICSTEVFYINNLAAAVGNSPKYMESVFQTVEEAVYQAKTAADNATAAAATAVNSGNSALSATENANIAAENASDAAENANTAAENANTAAENASNAVKNCVSKQDIDGCMTAELVWTNPTSASAFTTADITVENAENHLFYLFKYRNGISQNDIRTVVLYPGNSNVKITGHTVANVEATRTVTCITVDTVTSITVSADGQNGTSAIPLQIWAIGAI